MKYFVLIFLLGLIIILGLQSHLFSEKKDPAPKWTEPVNLGLVINSSYNEKFPMLSADGLSLYFSSDRPGSLGDSTATGFEALDIYVSHRKGIDAPWGKPVHLAAPINTRYADHSTAFSPDGHWMYFASTRPSADECGKHDLYRSYRPDTTDDLGWEEPKNLGCTINSPADDSCPFLVVDDTSGQTLLYFVSTRSGGPGSWDVYVSRLNKETDAFGAARLVKNINSPAFDGHFDGEHGMLWSGNKKGYGGGDLWITQKDNEGQWATPVNIGPPINTDHNEGCFTLSDDGATLFFTSDRPGGVGGYDLYMSTKQADSNQSSTYN